jgi:acetyl-CoA carboxylase carboxyl transferase subunit beta
MSWFSKKPRISTPDHEAEDKQPSRMQGLWVKCEDCNEIIYRQEVEKNLNVCTNCGFHLPWPARVRLEAVLDPHSFRELDSHLEPQDPLNFVDSKKYKDRLRSTRKTLQLPDAFISGMGELEGHPVSVGCFAFEFMGGSMGSVVGEKVARVFERGYEKNCAALIFSASGGARMQEGIFSLMQMAKTSAALARFRRRARPYISVMLHPTTGGVAASFAWLGDVILAEPKALIGFAGPRVIEQTIRQKLPEGFQRAEFLLEHGMIDAIVARKELRAKLGQLLGLMG